MELARAAGQPARPVTRCLCGRAASSSGLRVAAQTVPVGLAADAIRLLILDARGMALDPDAEADAEVQSFFIGEAELAS